MKLSDSKRIEAISLQAKIDLRDNLKEKLNGAYGERSKAIHSVIALLDYEIKELAITELLDEVL